MTIGMNKKWDADDPEIKTGTEVKKIFVHTLIHRKKVKNL